ncbi:hypothetical protein [Bradyrhizobium ottawaense]|uniref:hypothetical protein n=1 Tax=Bradyrhizobium ottawaense TaxID=931866 RepID=UPI0030F39060
MSYLADPTFPPGRVQIRKDNAMIAAAPVDALALFSYALVVRRRAARQPAHHDLHASLGAPRGEAEGCQVRPHASETVVLGQLVVQQPGDILVCRLADLQYVPGLNEDVDMIVNPAGVDAAKTMWFEDKGRMQ